MFSPKKLLFLAGLMLLSSVSYSQDIDESAFLLQQAMMESNADYNKHKKAFNNEEFDRADEWENRNTQAIVIDGKNRQNLEEFKQEVQDSERQDREVSSHPVKKDEDKHQD